MGRLGLATAAIATLAALLLSTASAEAASPRPFGKNGVIHVCFKVRGKDRGAMRIVKHPRRCKRMRGWRRAAWSAVGRPGVPGIPGAHGTDGAVERTLIERVEAQSTQIETLTEQVGSLTKELSDLEGLVASLTGGLTSLEGDVGGLEGTITGLTGELVSLEGNLLGLEGTVEGVCAQVGDLTTQADALLAGLAGAEVPLIGELVGLVFGTPLPDPLGEEFDCAPTP